MGAPVKQLKSDRGSTTNGRRSSAFPALHDPELTHRRRQIRRDRPAQVGKVRAAFRVVLAGASLARRSMPAAIAGEHVEQRPEVDLRPVLRGQTSQAVGAGSRTELAANTYD